MSLRWFGEGFDSASLSQIRQIAGVSGVITTLYDTQPGENAMPGYGLYDRAMGASDLLGLWEAIDKESKREAQS